MKYCLRPLVVFALMLSVKGVLFAQPPDAADSISGQVFDEATQTPISAARIAVWHNGHTLLKETKTAQDGSFSATTLLDQHQRQPGDTYVLLVRADGYAMQILTLNSGKTEGREIGLRLDKGAKFRVTDSKGELVATATIQLLTLYAPQLVEDATKALIPISLDQLTEKIAPVQSNDAGVITINGLSGSNGKFQVRAPGFASLERDASQVHQGAIQLSRETVLEGRILYEDTGLPFYHPTPVAKVQAWRNYRLWRQGPIKPDGSFEIGDIPSLELMGEKELSFNIELNIRDITQAVTGNGMTLRYAPNGYNAFVALDATENAPQKWYLGYVSTEEKGLVYAEGERVQLDYLLHPLARIKGKVLPLPGGEPATISYHDPSSWYADWAVSTDAQGNFEIFAPEGDVTLIYHLPENAVAKQLIQNLKAHETREIEFSVLPKP